MLRWKPQVRGSKKRRPSPTKPGNYSQMNQAKTLTSPASCYSSCQTYLVMRAIILRGRESSLKLACKCTDFLKTPSPQIMTFLCSSHSFAYKFPSASSCPVLPCTPSFPPHAPVASCKSEASFPPGLAPEATDCLDDEASEADRLVRLTKIDLLSQ